MANHIFILFSMFSMPSYIQHSIMLNHNKLNTKLIIYLQPSIIKFITHKKHHAITSKNEFKWIAMTYFLMYDVCKILYVAIDFQRSLSLFSLLILAMTLFDLSQSRFLLSLRNISKIVTEICLDQEVWFFI